MQFQHNSIIVISLGVQFPSICSISVHMSGYVPCSACSQWLVNLARPYLRKISSYWDVYIDVYIDMYHGYICVYGYISRVYVCFVCINWTSRHCICMGINVFIEDVHIRDSICIYMCVYINVYIFVFKCLYVCIYVCVLIDWTSRHCIWNSLESMLIKYL